jgi:acetyl-CoA C-acetyltransferase
MGDRDPVTSGGARTPIGRLLGSLAGFSAAELGGFAIKGAPDRAKVGPEQVEYVIMGHGQGSALLLRVPAGAAR